MANPIPNTTTQDGIREHTDIPRASLSRLTRELIEDELIEEELNRVAGAQRKRKTYWLTTLGTETAADVLKALGQRTLPDDEGERRSITDLLDEMDGTHLLPKIQALAATDDPGSMNTPPPASPTDSPSSSEEFSEISFTDLSDLVLALLGPDARSIRRTDDSVRLLFITSLLVFTTIGITEFGGRAQLRFSYSWPTLWMPIVSLALAVVVFWILGFSLLGVIMLVLLGAAIVTYASQMRDQAGEIQGVIRAALYQQRKRVLA